MGHLETLEAVLERDLTKLEADRQDLALQRLDLQRKIEAIQHQQLAAAAAQQAQLYGAAAGAAVAAGGAVLVANEQQPTLGLPPHPVDTSRPVANEQDPQRFLSL